MRAGRAAGHARRRPSDRRGVDRPCHRHALTPSAVRTARRGAAGAAVVDRLHGFGPVVGLVLLCIAGTLLNSDFATARQRDERAHPHRLHRHHRGRHVLRHHLGRHRSVGRLDGGADRRLRDPADERAGAARLGSPLLVVALGMAFAVRARRACSAWRTACSSRAAASSPSSSRWARSASSAPTSPTSPTAARSRSTTRSSDVYSPVYYASLLGVPVPVWVFALVALAGGADPQPHRLRPLRAGDRLERAGGALRRGRRRPRQGADLRAARRLRGRRDAAVRAAPRLGLADHRPAVGAGGDRRGDRRRHRAARAAPAASPAP